MAIARMHDRDRFDALARHGFRFAALGSVVFIGLAVAIPEFRTSQNSLLFNVVGYSLVGVVMVGIVGAVVAAPRESIVHRDLPNALGKSPGRPSRRDLRGYGA